MASLSAQLVPHGLFPDRPTGTVSAVPLNSDRSTQVPVPKLHATGTSCFGGGLLLRLRPKRRIASCQSWFRETCSFFQGVGQRVVQPRAVHCEIFFASTTETTRVPVQQLPVFRHSCMPRIVISCRIPPCGPQTTDTKQQTMSRDKADKRTGQIDSWTASRTWPGQRNDHNPFR